jgi:hypothetical protein
MPRLGEGERIPGTRGRMPRRIDSGRVRGPASADADKRRFRPRGDARLGGR